MSKADAYLTKANEADMFAETAATAEYRDAWRKIALGYRALADQSERRPAYGPLGSLRGDALLADNDTQADTAGGNETALPALRGRSE